MYSCTDTSLQHYMNISEPNHDYFISSEAREISSQKPAIPNAEAAYEQLPPNLDYDSSAILMAKTQDVRSFVVQLCEAHAEER